MGSLQFIFNHSKLNYFHFLRIPGRQDHSTVENNAIICNIPHMSLWIIKVFGYDFFFKCNLS